MRAKKYFTVLLYSLCCLVLLFSCKKQDEAGFPGQPVGPFPIFQSEININSLISNSDSNLLVNPDGLLIYYFLQDSTFRIPSSSLVFMPELTSYSNEIRLGIVQLPEFYFPDTLSLNDILPFIETSVADTLVANDTTMHIFPAIQTSGTIVLTKGPSTDYNTLSFVSGFIEIKVINILPVKLENVQLQVKDAKFSTVLSDIYIAELDSGEIYFENIPLEVKKLSNHLSVDISNLSSPGSGEKEVFIDLKQGLSIEMTFKDAKTVAGISTVEEQLIAQNTQMIDLFSAGNERFYEALLKNGSMNYAINAMKHVNVEVVVSFPTALFEQEMVKDSIFARNKEVHEGSFSLSDFLINFTSDPTKPFSRFPVTTSVYLLKTDTLVAIDSADKININLNFSSIETQFAAGYFGKKSFQTEETSMDFDLNFLDRIDGEVQFNTMEIGLEYFNSLGMPLKILPEIRAQNTQTGILKTLITDSVAINYPVSPGDLSSGEINFTNENSNVAELISINPNRLFFEMGGLSNWSFVPSNFVFDTSAFYGNSIVKIPLVLYSDYLVFSDTINVDIADNISTVGQGTVFLDVKNGFPFTMKLQMLVIEPISGQIVETVNFDNINAASVNANGKVTQPLDARLSAAVDGNFFYNLKRSKYVVLKMVSSTLENGSVPVSLYSYYNTSLNFSFEFKFE